MEHSIEAKRSRRGIFLLILLANYILVSLSRLLILLFPNFFANIYAGWPSWGYTFNLFIFIVEVIGIIGIFIWRKWGVYLIVTITLVGISEDFLYLSSQKSITDLLLTIPILALFIWAVSRKWSYFQ
jgi:hypothetical protein